MLKKIHKNTKKNPKKYKKIQKQTKKKLFSFFG